MADKEREKKILPPKVPRPNYQMWVILVLVAVILGISYLNRSGELVEIQSSRFEDMVQARDIKRLVLIKNEELIEITLKPEALQNAKYKQEIEIYLVSIMNNIQVAEKKYYPDSYQECPLRPVKNITKQKI